MMKKTQRGFMVVSAIVLSVVVGLMAASVAYLYSTGGRSSANQVMTTQALYIAEAGLEVGINSVRKPMVATRVGCGSASAGPIPFAQGSYTITGAAYAPSLTALTAAINNTSSVIPIASVSGYAPSGFIILDEEIIDYGSIGTTGSACSPYAAPCLIGAVRGQNSTTAASHNINAPLRQNNLCEITSVGSVTSGATTLASRTVKTVVQFARPTLIGNANSGELIASWDGRQWIRTTPVASIEDENIYGLSILGFWNGFSVGDKMAPAVCGGAVKAFLMSLNPVLYTWQQMTCGQNTDVNAALLDLHCFNTANCKSAGKGPTFAQWDGSTWSQAPYESTGPNRIPATDMQGVSCLSSNNCFAVGKAQAGEMIAEWDGTIWSRAANTALPNNIDLFAITCIAGPFCVITGSNGEIAHYTGSWGIPSASVPAVNLNGVFCVSSSDCWAVGDASGGAVFAHWNGSAWSRDTGLIGTSPSVSMTSVFCADTNNCWTVGLSGGAFWDGTLWTDASMGLSGLTANKVAGVPGVIDRTFGFQEVFN